VACLVHKGNLEQRGHKVLRVLLVQPAHKVLLATTALMALKVLPEQMVRSAPKVRQDCRAIVVRKALLVCRGLSGQLERKAPLGHKVRRDPKARLVMTGRQARKATPVRRVPKGLLG
jgi:hypothetical protein